MLGSKNVMATIAVKDIEVAKKFYENVLGLTRSDSGEDPAGIRYNSGGSQLFVYPSQYAGTNQATAASWTVGDDLATIVNELKTKGVTFETYDLPGVTREGDIHTMGDLKAVWFKDPDGNILNIVNGQ